MWSPNELLKTEKQRDILSYITLQFFPFKKVPLEHYPKIGGFFWCTISGSVQKTVQCTVFSDRSPRGEYKPHRGAA